MRARELLLAGALGVAAACAPRHAFDNPERPPPTPPPQSAPAFGSARLHESMWKMAGAVEKVNVIMRRSEAPLTPEEQARIVELLGEMEEVAAVLANEDARDLHPVLGKNIDFFLKDIATSRRMASADPPNFFMAGTVAGACGYCHGVGFGKVRADLIRERD